MAVDPQDIAQELWDLLKSGDRDVIREDDASLVGNLRDSLGLPPVPRAETPLIIPARLPGASVVLEPEGECYVVRADSAVASPVEIDTRKGVLVVDSDDPLARVQKSIEGLESIEF